ncbi:5-hydroxytryptamine receptor 1B-like [Leptidea sinapis]|uniref:5-hydroxytryptamine receptor 1B-like n=1 Tax=Leptidea sinapis TaxID=189913 RepID=UPI00213DE92B|nr:5-hydroxytryptamine receptor 1B-like [Leptidea sinapis]
MTAELDPAIPATEPVLPPLVLAVFIACIAGAGFFANCVLFAAVLRRATNGIYSIIAQLTVIDSLLLCVSIAFELWSYNNRTWTFGRASCIAFRGTSVLSSTASLYLVATIALHTLATINLQEKVTAQRLKRISSDEEETRSSHSLVEHEASSQPRTVLVDYRTVDTVSVVPPSVFVWILSASLSIPEFTLSTTLRLDHNTIVCTLVDTDHRVDILYSMLALFNFYLPTLLMSATGIILFRKFKSYRPALIEHVESKQALKLSLYLIVSYFVLCAPRSIFYVYGFYSISSIDDRDSVRHNETLVRISLVVSSLYLVAIFIRPLLCFTFLPRMRKKVSCKLYDGTDVEEL